MTVTSAILAILAALLPLLLQWLESKTDTSLEDLRERNEQALEKLSEAMRDNDATSVAASWAEHDRRLRNEGILTDESARDRDRGRVGDISGDRARDVHRDRGLDASADGSGTSSRGGAEAVPERRSIRDFNLRPRGLNR